MKPVATCICVTQNRRFFLRQAVAYFQRANGIAYDRWANLAELIIVDGSPEPHPLATGWGATVRYYHEPSPEHARTGYFHNRACELAQSDIIIQWDDDDWHSPTRIVDQVMVLDSMPQDGITFTSKFYWYHLLEKQAAESRTWYVGESSVGAMFAYHRRAWEHIPFRDVPQGEDNYFFDDHKATGTPMVDTQDSTMCLYVRHNRNGSPLVQVNYQEQATDEARELLRASNDLSFYDELAEIMPREPWNRPHPMATSPYAMHMQVMQARTRQK